MIPVQTYKIRKGGRALFNRVHRTATVCCAASCSSVTASKQGVVLRRLLATDAQLAGLQLFQGREGDTEALGSHGRSTGLQVLVPGGHNTTDVFCMSALVELRKTDVYVAVLFNILGSDFLDPVLALNPATERDLDNL